MTPAEILEDAKSRFMVLYHDDPDALARLLRQALGKYQDKAGVILEAWQEGTAFKIPQHFHTVAGCCDTRRRYVPWRYGTAENEAGETVRVIELDVGKRHAAPYCLYFFCDLRNWDMDEPLPGDCDALLCDYLEALIALQNTKREREAYLTAGMAEAAQTLPVEQELRQRVAELEAAMEDNKAIVPPASMF
ncbi:MAG: hypothetical protein E7022_03190 [Desulfovibrio desulfuricans]|nr:hypothetical protein [Desulfovibrio desulfuricans]